MNRHLVAPLIVLVLLGSLWLVQREVAKVNAPPPAVATQPRDFLASNPGVHYDDRNAFNDGTASTIAIGLGGIAFAVFAFIIAPIMLFWAFARGIANVFADSNARRMREELDRRDEYVLQRRHAPRRHAGPPYLDDDDARS
jgi:hypothetical protein